MNDTSSSAAQPLPNDSPSGAGKGIDSDLDEIRRIKLLKTVQDELITWAKGRLIVISALSGVIGIFGIYFMIENAITTIIEKPTKQYLQKAQDSIDQITIATAQSRSITAGAQEAITGAAHAAQNATDAAQKVTDALKNIEETEKKVQDRLDSVRSTIDDYATTVFETKLKGDYRDKILSENTEYLSSTISLLERFVGDLYVDVNRGKVSAASFNAAYQTLQKEQIKLKTGHDEALSALNQRATYKVIVYIQRRIGVDSIADEVVAKLQDAGFRAELWRASGDTADQAAKDIRNEFWNVESAFSKSNRALVVPPNGMSMANQVMDALKPVGAFNSLPLVFENIIPSSDHLKGLSGYIYQADHVFLLYVLASK